MKWRRNIGQVLVVILAIWLINGLLHTVTFINYSFPITRDWAMIQARQAECQQKGQILKRQEVERMLEGKTWHHFNWLYSPEITGGEDSWKVVFKPEQPSLVYRIWNAYWRWEFGQRPPTTYEIASGELDVRRIEPIPSTTQVSK